MLDHYGKNPQQFAEFAHAEIRKLFSRQPSGSTPILANMIQMFHDARGNTMHYLLTDGEPTDGKVEIQNIKELLIKRNNPRNNPFTFLSCSDRPEDHEWMHEIEEETGSKYFVASVPDFKNERQEVLEHQGPVFPYSRGFWLLCNIAHAINPHDLAALDQNPPLTKLTIQSLLGRQFSDNEYRRYFEHHPNAKRVFEPDYTLFLTKEAAIEIPSVKLFKDTLAQNISNNLCEDRAIANADQVVQQYFNCGRQLPKVSQLGMWGPSQTGGSEKRPLSQMEGNICEVCVLL